MTTPNMQALSAEKRLKKLMRTKRASVASSNCEYVSLRYHRTDVATCDLERGLVWFDDGGHRTLTTKTRMNQFCETLDFPIRVFQKSFEWFVDVAGVVRPYKAGEPLPVRRPSRSERDVRLALPSIRSCKLDPPHFGERAMRDLPSCPVCAVEKLQERSAA